MKRVFAVGILLALLLTGCSKPEVWSVPEGVVQQGTEPTEATEPVTEESTHQVPEASFLKGASAPRMDIPAAGLADLYVVQRELGNFGADDREEVLLLGDDSGALYIAMERAEGLIVEDVTQFYKQENGEPYYYRSNYAKIMLYDLNSDGIDDVALQQCIGSTGGFGNWNCRVYSVKSNGIFQVYNTDIYEGNENVPSADTGFSFTVNPDYSVTVKNSYTGKSQTLDSERVKGIAENYISDYTEPVSDKPLWTDSFYSFEPEQQEDGSYIVKCLQYACIGSHVDCIGAAQIVLKYDSSTGTLVIVDSGFLAYEEIADYEPPLSNVN